MCKLCQKDKTAEDEQLNIFNQSGEVSSSPPVAATVVLTMRENEQQPPGTPSPLQPLISSPLPPPLPPLPQQPIPLQQQLQLLHHHTNSSTSSASLSVGDEKVVVEASDNINSLLTTTTTSMDDGTGGQQEENASGEQQMSSEKTTAIFPATLYSSIFDRSLASNSSINSVALATFLQVQSFQEFDSETLDTDYIGDNIVGYFNESTNHVVGDIDNFLEMYGKVFFVRGLSTSSADSSSTCCDIAIIWKVDEMDSACQVERLAVKDYEYLLSQR